MGALGKSFCQIATLAAAIALLPFSANAQIGHCKIFRHSDAGAPAAVLDFLNRFNKSVIYSCGSDEHPDYYEASEPIKSVGVCRYSGYDLKLSGARPAHLERPTSSQQTYILITNSACPSPATGGGYTAINKIEQTEAVKLIRVWRDAVSRIDNFHSIFRISDAAALRLRSQISQGKSDLLTIEKIDTREDFWLWKNYELIVRDPEKHGGIYFVTVKRWFGMIYAVSDIAIGFR